MAAATSGSSGSGSVDPAVQLSPVVSPSGPAATGDVKIEINSAGAAAAAAAAGDAVKPSVKTLYLIRHGESTMNEFRMKASTWYDDAGWMVRGWGLGDPISSHMI